MSKRNLYTSMVAAACLAVTMGSSAAYAASQPAQGSVTAPSVAAKLPVPDANRSNASKPIELAQRRRGRRWRGRGGWRGRRGHRRWRHRRSRGAAAAAAGIAGLIIGSAIIDGTRARGHRSDWQRCDDRYRSFRWSDGTFQPYGDGPRRLCPYLR